MRCERVPQKPPRRRHPPTRPNTPSRPTSARLLDQIRALPARQRDCVLLKYYLDLSEAEMASALGVSTGSIKTHLSRARAAFAIRMEDKW